LSSPYAEPKDSHYEKHPEESTIVRSIYERLIYHGMTAKAVARWLNDNHVPKRLAGKVWDTSAVCNIIKSTVYKGELYANRLFQEKTDKYTAKGRPGKRTRIRPEEDWIKINVPAIVTVQEWDQAQAALQRNSVWHLRNGKMRGWLLQGMLKCQNCNKFIMRAITRKTDSRLEDYRYYICGSKYNGKGYGGIPKTFTARPARWTYTWRT
jgi:site-specific DNA recombinase